jgi:hypothetical protein
MNRSCTYFSSTSAARGGGENGQAAAVSASVNRARSSSESASAACDCVICRLLEFSHANTSAQQPRRRVPACSNGSKVCPSGLIIRRHYYHTYRIHQAPINVSGPYCRGPTLEAMAAPQFPRRVPSPSRRCVSPQAGPCDGDGLQGIHCPAQDCRRRQVGRRGFELKLK